MEQQALPSSVNPGEVLARRIRHARANIRHAEQLQDSMNAEAWRALMDARHEELNELLDKVAAESTDPVSTSNPQPH